MSRFFYIFVILTILSACGGSGGGGGNPVFADINGTWGFLYEENLCHESYHFFEDGSLEINSGSQIVQGTYTFQESVGRNERHRLDITLVSGNSEPDCLGFVQSVAGYSGTIYIEFEDANTITWYDLADRGSPLVTMESVTSIPLSEAPDLRLNDDIVAYERNAVSLKAEIETSESVSYSWEQVRGPAASMQGENSRDLRVVLPEVDDDTTLIFNFTVTFEDGSTLSDQVIVDVNASIALEDIQLQDPALAACITEIINTTDLVEATEIESLSCENVSDITGIEQINSLTSLTLIDNTLTSLEPLMALTSVETLDLSGNSSLPCEQIDSVKLTLSELSEFSTDDLCVASRGVELGAIGFDVAIDEGRDQIYVSIPTTNEIAVISTTQLRVVDRILLGGAPYGIDLSIDQGSLFVAVRGTDSIAVIDLDSREVESIPLANQTGHSDLYDVVEAAPNRVFVSSAPGSSGSAYIAQIDLDESNIATRAASQRIIRASPRLARSPDYNFLYVSEGFSPNSLYKLNLMDPDAPIILEDDHGNVSGTYNMSINPSGSRIALASGQVLRTGSFIEAGRVTAGLSVASQTDNYLYVLSDNSDLEVFDFDTLDQVDLLDSACDYGSTSRIGVFGNNSNDLMFLQRDVLCLKTEISQSEPSDPYPELTFNDLALEECVISAAVANGYTLPSEFESLDCSSSEKRIINLESIQKLINLESLDISGHSVFSLEPLSELESLISVTVRNSEVSSLAPLSDLGILSEVDVTGSEGITCDELTEFQSNGISVSADFCTQTARLELGGIGSDMEFQTSTNKLLVSVPSLEQVVEIDIDSENVSNSYPMGGEVRRIDLSSDDETLYATLYGEGDIAYLQLSDGSVEVVDISTELDDDRTWDIAEVSPDRIVVSSNPYSNGFAYIVEVRRDLENAATRVADQRIIRASPEIVVSEDSSSVYVGSGFSPNSLYRLDANQPDMPISIEDDHGSVSGTNHLTVNSSNTLIYLASGQVLSTVNFTQVATFNAGRSWLSEDEQFLFVADGESNAVGIYDVATTAKVGRSEFGCDVTGILKLIEIPDVGISVLGDDLVCFTRVIPFN